MTPAPPRLTRSAIRAEPVITVATGPRQRPRKHRHDIAGIDENAFLHEEGVEHADTAANGEDDADDDLPEQMSLAKRLRGQRHQHRSDQQVGQAS